MNVVDPAAASGWVFDRPIAIAHRWDFWAFGEARSDPPVVFGALGRQFGEVVRDPLRLVPVGPELRVRDAVEGGPEIAEREGPEARETDVPTAEGGQRVEQRALSDEPPDLLLLLD